MNLYDNEKLEYLIKEYSNTIYRLAFIRMKSRELAEDIMQDVFLKLVEQKHPNDSDEHLKAWLIRTTINCCNDHWKSPWFKKRVYIEDNEESSYSMSHSGSVGRITECVMKLPKKYRAIIHLYYYEEYSIKEIADILTLNENTVRTRMSRGRHLLKQYLGEEADNYEF